MNFELLLERAKTGDKEAREEIFRMYRPLLIKNAIDRNVFDEDLYQELLLIIKLSAPTFVKLF